VFALDGGRKRHPTARYPAGDRRGRSGYVRVSIRNRERFWNREASSRRVGSTRFREVQASWGSGARTDPRSPVLFCCSIFEQLLRLDSPLFTKRGGPSLVRTQDTRGRGGDPFCLRNGDQARPRPDHYRNVNPVLVFPRSWLPWGTACGQEAKRLCHYTSHALR